MFEERFLRLSEVVQKVGLRKTWIYENVKKGRFPRPRKYPGSNRSYWLLSEITDWQRLQQNLSVLG